MPRLIDANALIDEWNTLIKKMHKDSDGAYPVDFAIVISAVSKAPTVDAVEVVRCKDCKHYLYDDFDGAYVCMQLSKYVKPDFWCAHGERKDDD